MAGTPNNRHGGERSDASPPHVMFLPVSGPAGSGEYVRCLTIARAARERWPELRVSFVLDRAAPYAAGCPFQTHLIDGSPTANPGAVRERLERERPQVAVFDNAGRLATIALARSLGCRTVYVSRRPAKRRKAFRLRALAALDQHWIAFPAFIEGPLSAWERLKLRLHPRVEVVFLGAVYAESQAERRARLLAEHGLGGERYVLFTGGGGGRHPRGAAAPAVFAAAAAALARDTGTKAVVVAGQSAAAAAAATPGLVSLGALAPEHLIDLIAGAALVACNGGTTLTQTLAHRKPCVAVAIASDQHRRVRICARRGLVVPAPLAAGPLAAAAARLLADEREREAMAARVATTRLDNGVPRALAALARLLPAERLRE